MNNILKQIDEWANTSFFQLLTQARNENLLTTTQKEDLLQQLHYLRKEEQEFSEFKEKFMQTKFDGSFSQGWRDLNNNGPLFQESLHNVMSKYPQNWTPAEYLMDYYFQCLNQNIKINKIDLGRALRNLPSFLREYILADKINQLNLPNVKVEVPSVSLNAQEHADLFLYVDDKKITLWSYQKTPHAILRLKTKLNHRGKVINGFNLLAPIGKDFNDVEWHHNWYIPNTKYVTTLINVCKSCNEQNITHFNKILKDTQQPTTKHFDNFRIFVK